MKTLAMIMAVAGLVLALATAAQAGFINVDFGTTAVYQGEGPAGAKGGTTWNRVDAVDTIYDLVDSAGNPTGATVKVPKSHLGTGPFMTTTAPQDNNALWSDSLATDYQHVGEIYFSGLPANSTFDVYLMGLGEEGAETQFTMVDAFGGDYGSVFGPATDGPITWSSPQNYIKLHATTYNDLFRVAFRTRNQVGGNSHVYGLQISPEPGTLAMLLLGLPFVMRRKRR